MTVHRKIAKLKMSLEEAKSYSPSRGIDVIWLECIHADGTTHGEGVCPKASEVVAELVTADNNPAEGEAHNAEFLDFELASVELEFRKNSESVVVEQELVSHANSPPVALSLDIRYLDGVPEALSWGQAIDVKIRGRFASAAATLSVDGKIIAVDQADESKPGVRFPLPRAPQGNYQTGNYRLEITVTDKNGNQHPYAFDYVLS